MNSIKSSKYLIILFLLSFSACKRNISYKASHSKADKEEIQIAKKTDSLLKLSKSKQAHAYIDSLLLTKKIGALYYQKGVIYAYDMKFKDALQVLEKALQLKYDSLKCKRMIVFCKTMSDDAKKYK